MKTKMTKVYIASPYTQGDKIENVNRQIDTADELMDKGFLPFVPLLFHYHHDVHPRSYDDWMEIDIAWLENCTCVLRLPGESKGADIEVAHAERVGIPVYYSIKELCEKN